MPDRVEVQLQLGDVAQQADVQWRAVLAAGPRAYWWSRRSTVGLILTYMDLGLSGDDITEALLELALMREFDAHNLSHQQMARLTGRHRGNVYKRRRRLIAAEVLEVDRRPGRASITVPGPKTWAIVDRVEGVRLEVSAPTADTPPAPPPRAPTADTPRAPTADTPRAPTADTPRAPTARGLKRRDSEMEERSAASGSEAFIACRRPGCAAPVDLDPAGVPYPECRGHALGDWRGLPPPPLLAGAVKHVEDLEPPADDELRRRAIVRAREALRSSRRAPAGVTAAGAEILADTDHARRVAELRARADEILANPKFKPTEIEL